MNKANKSGIYTDDFYKKYIETQKNSSESLKKEILKIKKFTDLKGPICDLGSGIGLFLKACEEFGLVATGIEGSKTAAGYANKITRNKTIIHNLEKPLPVKDESFQAVYCNQVLEHLKPETALLVISEAYRILQPLGLFVCSSPNNFDLSERVPEHINLYSPTKLKKILEKNHFSVIYEHLSFNISLLTPWENPVQGKTGKIRLFLKRYSAIINILFSPFWLPIRLLNSKLLNTELLDIFSGTCYFIARKEDYNSES